MIVTVTINTDSAAFEGQPGQELSRILSNLAERVNYWPGYNTFTIGLRDKDGNKVGICKAEKI